MKNFTIIPNQIFGQSQLPVPARFLYCVLLKYCGKDEYCFPSQITLGKILGYTDKHIRTLLNELIGAGLVSRKRSGWNRSNTYHVQKLLDTDRKLISVPSQTSSPPQSGKKVPIHNETVVPSINTYLKGKGKRSLKGLEKCRRKLEEMGLKEHTTVVIKPKLNEYEKH
ncbi:helix-turn-helix domain-containing protein [Patescibacteria group bacterium]|nr:helix-turn-helix domain-containing protein [Patescibacteria group bacterium]MBU4274976.1 helix-turn-helix domain-containing protein [Patescibacteria group bacterium]MBU4430747.1 helix-turn-helix domain-containing protein [Patescibacteria group bacterium]MBU4578656.1 helix-turn-helix domain-containing protein [Patescibacteria group bacterium]MCG2702575.1 helix-turn-helix domain-containing protein [Candidatus Parcubacteria bacterium]